MSLPRISPRAFEDLIEIWSYIADDSEVSADAFVDNFYEKVQVIGSQPGSGRRREELAPGMRSFPFGHYVVFYRVISEVTEIVRVLHGARDIESIFDSREWRIDPS